VCRFWDTALRAARGPLVAPLSEIGPSLAWAQNPNYRRRPPDAAFLDNYGYAVIAGPLEGPPALVPDARVALGVLLLGPRTHYPLHAHPAVEVYVTLTADGEWWREDGPWRGTPAGTVIHHPSGVPHATRAGDTPLLAVYVWRGELATHARLRA
jgi:quercetin dioxygenase-like cupin family protein